MRKRLFEIIELSRDNDRLSSLYDIAMIFVIIASLVPLAFKEPTPVLAVIEWVTTAIFIIDYVLRLWTADYKLSKGKLSFLLYPLTPLAIIDLLCILPSFLALSGSFRLLKIIRLIRAFRVIRALKGLRYSKNMLIIANVIRKQRTALISVFTLAFSYIMISALVIFNVEPDSFDNFFDAVYWATVSLTTVGYGDIYPVTDAGRIITMISSILGIAVVALPAGIITAGYLSELGNEKEPKE
ncbi:MAG: ion transporter [Oscillospiraceae bacterium]|nr:ion transporter [Oscillospiraceae bacterium]